MNLEHDPPAWAGFGFHSVTRSVVARMLEKPSQPVVRLRGGMRSLADTLAIHWRHLR
jgi:hypothetical protein